MTHIEEALSLVLADLAAEGGPMPRVEPRTEEGDTLLGVMLWAGDGSGSGARLDLTLPSAEALAQLADEVQEWVIEERARLRRPTNWPPCAAHPATHPCRPTAREGRAWWVCPRELADPVPIGEFDEAKHGRLRRA